MLNFDFFFLTSVRCCTSFSVPTTTTGGGPGSTPIKTQPYEPTILSLPDIFAPQEIHEMLEIIETSREKGQLVPTSTYQEDVFSRHAWKRKDEFLTSIIKPLLLHDNNNNNSLIPSEYCTNPLQMFVYAVTKHKDQLSEEDIILGAL